MTDQKQKNRELDRSDWIALVAMALSFLAVGVSVYEVRILKEQQLIMASQQKAVVWPYLKLNYQIKSEMEEMFIILSVENKGVGPALIENAQLSLGDYVIGSYTDLTDTLLAIFPDSVDVGPSLSDLNQSLLSPGEKAEIIRIQYRSFPDKWKVSRALQFNYSLCFCSIYKECWKMSLRENIPSEGCSS
ncbi:MAG: hypothetical protein AAF694_31225 [Bacteroidota bacterium]